MPTDFGLGGVFSLNTTALGSWKRTGPRQITDVRLHLVFDNPGGVPTSVVRTTSVTNFGRHFNTGTGLANQRTYDLAAGEDPLDPNQGTPDPTSIPYTFGRLIP